jgi:hypothetical protein
MVVLYNTDMYREKRINYGKVTFVLILLAVIAGLLYALDRFGGPEVQDALQSIEDCVAIDGSYPSNCTLPAGNLE